MAPVDSGRRKEQSLSPAETLKCLAAKYQMDVFSSEFAALMDSQDPLRDFRKRFAIPLKNTLTAVDQSSVDATEECIYFCGNSLGLKPHKADDYVKAQLDKWAKKGVEVHFEEPLPAALCDRYGREQLGRLVGADPSCVTLMNGLTVNLHLLLLSFYRPTEERYKILIEGHAFPSDRYAMKSQAQLHGFDPNEAVLEVSPRPGEQTIRTEDILKVIEEKGSQIAVVCLSGVQYYTGQKFDMEAITAAAHEQGCLVGWDLAHAVGNVRIELDRWGVDFACWCTYKYLNSGAGGIAGAYVNKSHSDRQGGLKGWWSNRESTRFEMALDCDVAPGVDGFRLCNPPPILVALVMASLEIFDEAGMDKLLDKQFLLTGYLELLLIHYFSIDSRDAPSVNVITPSDVTQRGCQLSLEFSCPLNEVHRQLQKLGVVCDVRTPNAMRLAPAPLYNSFTDIHSFVDILQEVFKRCKVAAA